MRKELFARASPRRNLRRNRAIFVEFIFDGQIALNGRGICHQIFEGWDRNRLGGTNEFQNEMVFLDALTHHDWVPISPERQAV